MSANPGGGPFRPADAETVAELRRLVGAARHAALATLEPATGHPLATRVGLATLADGTPLILVSRLAAHTPALLADPRCSLLVGAIGRGDPLAHGRATLYCRAEPIERQTEAGEEALARYLAANRKAKLYAALPDFCLFALRVERITFNGGFGRAYRLTASDYYGGW